MPEQVCNVRLPNPVERQAAQHRQDVYAKDDLIILPTALLALDVASSVHGKLSKRGNGSQFGSSLLRVCANDSLR
jgi:hypothetical protein